MRSTKLTHDFHAINNTFSFYFAPLTQKLKKSMGKEKYNEQSGGYGEDFS